VLLTDRGDTADLGPDVLRDVRTRVEVQVRPDVARFEGDGVDPADHVAQVGDVGVLVQAAGVRHLERDVGPVPPQRGGDLEVDHGHDRQCEDRDDGEDRQLDLDKPGHRGASSVAGAEAPAGSSAGSPPSAGGCATSSENGSACADASWAKPTYPSSPAIRSPNSVPNRNVSLRRSLVMSASI